MASASRRRTGLALVVSALALASACGGRQTKPVPPPSAKLSSIPSGGARDGTVSYEAIVDPNGMGSRLQAQRSFFAPGPYPTNESPRYPEDLVRLGLGPQEIVVRIIVDERGCVSQVRRAPHPFEANPLHEGALFGAVVDAVMGWRFRPARLRTYTDVDDGSGAPPYQVLKAELPVRTYIDVRFLFEVRNGTGVVTAPQ